jgi:hypothetical protein
MPDVDPRSVPFDVGAVYISGGGQKYMNIYSLSSIKYCRLITIPFIAGLLWAMVLWIMRLMADGLLHRLVGLIKVARLK